MHLNRMQLQDAVKIQVCLYMKMRRPLMPTFNETHNQLGIRETLGLWTFLENQYWWAFIRLFLYE